MKIIAGCARNVELAAPPGVAVRPTAVRSRKALFDSIGPRLAGASVADLFSGSGALALEAASRGAAELLAVELNPAHVRVIEENLRRVRRAGFDGEFTIVNVDALELTRYSKRISHVDFLFADPPYAQSGRYFRALLENPRFAEDFSGAELFWEIPDTPGAAGDFLHPERLSKWLLREFAGTRFLQGVVGE